MAAGIKVEGFDKIDANLEKVLTGAKEKRAQLHEKVATELKAAVDQSIGKNLNDANGKVRNWQVRHVGSLGGYAAVHPGDMQYRGLAVGAVTNYLEVGHKVRVARTLKGAKRSKSKKIRVVGRFFYNAVKTDAKRIGIEASEEFAEWVKSQIESG